MGQTDISEVWRIVLGLSIGLALGLGLSFTELARRGCSGAVSVAADVIYAALAGLGAFAYSMTAPSGIMGTWELAAILIGVLTWVRTGAAEKTEKYAGKFASNLAKKLKKIKSDRKI